MKIENNRLAKRNYLQSLLLSVPLTILLIVLDIINVNPIGYVAYIVAIVVCMVVPLLIGIIEYQVTKKTILLDDGGVTEYKKGKVVKFFKFDEIKYVQISNSTIYIRIPNKSDYPYENIGLVVAIFKLLTSKDFRKRYAETTISFANNKHGFEQYELPFILELAKRCEFNFAIQHIGDFRSEKNITKLNAAAKACLSTAP